MTFESSFFSLKSVLKQRFFCPLQFSDLIIYIEVTKTIAATTVVHLPSLSPFAVWQI